MDLLKASGKTNSKLSDTESAAIWLAKFMKSGEAIPKKDVVEAAAAHGLTARTIERAAQEIVHVDVVKPDALGGKWSWQLPAKKRRAFEAWRYERCNLQD